MIQSNLLFTMLLAFCAFFSCSTETEEYAENLWVEQSNVARVRPIKADTIGLYQAFRAFSVQNSCKQCPNEKDLSPAYWQLLTMTDETSGLIPASSYLDDSTGFRTLFFRREKGRFHFYCVDSFQEPHMLEPDIQESINTVQLVTGR